MRQAVTLSDDGHQLDMADVSHVEVEVRNDGTVLWVHLDGRTVLRVCRIATLTIRDHRGEGDVQATG